MAENQITELETSAVTPAEVQRMVDSQLQKEATALRKDFITIFGLFAAFLTFTVLQIQALIQTTRMGFIIGASSFFVASSLTFVIAIHTVVIRQKVELKNLIPFTVLILVMFFFSFECFWFVTHSNTLWLFG